MTVPTDRTYPVNATNKAWQAKKSFLDKAKSSTKTGLGDTLKEAEASWKAIPWADLDASTKTAATPAGAEKLLATAKLALVKVAKAKVDLLAAKEQAKTTKANKALSKAAMAAATQIQIDLNTAINRLGKVKLTDFDTLVLKIQSEALTRMTNVRVRLGNEQVMTGGSATWDRTTLKVSDVVWKQGTANDIKGKKVTVNGDTRGNQNAEGVSRIFTSDMKLTAASGNTAEFKSN